MDADADPNAITVDDRGPLLKPPIGEYFNSADPPCCDVVRLLLRYGARIVIKVKNIVQKKLLVKIVEKKILAKIVHKIL